MNLIEIMEKENAKLKEKVGGLKDLVKEAKTKIDVDANTIKNLKKVVSEQKEDISKFNDFVSEIKKRENKIVNLFNKLKAHFEEKYNNGRSCFKILRRQRSDALALVLSLGDLLVEEESIPDSPSHHSPRQQM